MAKILNLASFGAVFSHFCPNKCEIRHDGTPPCQISRLSGQHVPPAEQKPIFVPLSKSNTGMAALSAGLPVIIEHRTQEKLK